MSRARDVGDHLRDMCIEERRGLHIAYYVRSIGAYRRAAALNLTMLVLFAFADTEHSHYTLLLLLYHFLVNGSL